MIKKLAIFLLFFCACTLAEDYSQLTVSKVIDGDTIELSNGQRLRYIGIDTPEVTVKKGNDFIFSPQPFALEAKEYNRKLVEGKPLRLEFDLEKKDRYGRLLAYCFVEDTFVNAKLIEEGYAVTYTKPPNIKYSDQLISLQKNAKQQNKGLWGAYETIDHSQAHNYINQIRTVRGKIVNTYDSGKAVFLNFGTNYKEDFTVVIFYSSLKFFLDKGINPATFYKGKTVEVAGKIKEFNGPEIIVNTPGEIDVLDNE